MHDADVEEYLRHFGYLGAVANAESFDDALIRFQRRFSLATTGRVDDATRAAMARPRCGVPDPQPGTRVLGMGDAWQKQRLAWTVEQSTQQVPDASAAVAMACDIWSTYTPLSFVEVGPGESADIIVRFDSGAHGDGFPHDGPGNVLAHAFFPPPLSVGDELAGDMHFDDDEAWTVRMPIAANEFDLVTVALHELGHSLGLDHSFDHGDIMFPFITGVQRHLSDADITRIRALYGDGHDGRGDPFDGHATTALWYTGPDQLHCFTVTPVKGRRTKRQVAGVWGPWRELGGEYEPSFSVNPAGVAVGDASVVFARSHQQAIYAQHLGAVDGPVHDLGGSHASSFFATGMAGRPTVFVNAREPDPDVLPSLGQRPMLLLERSFDGATLTPWAVVASDVPVLPAVATHADDSATLVACVSGGLMAAEGSVGSWSEFVALPDHPPLDLGYPFEPISAASTSETTLDVVAVTSDRELIHTRRDVGSWSEWHSFGHDWNRGTLASDGMGNLALVAGRHRGRAFLTRLEDGGWTDWQQLGDRNAIFGVAAQAGRMDLILRRAPRGVSTHHTLPF